MRLGLPHKLSISFLLLLWLLVTSSGCMTKIAADRIVAAPNTYAPTITDQQLAPLWKALLPKETNLNFVTVTVPVGPPAAQLKVLEMPPRNYHLKLTTKISTSKSGNRVLDLSGEPDDTMTFTPLPKPATIIVLHGYTLFKESMIPWAFTLAQAGYRVILVDLRGHGQSTGQQVSFGKYETTDLTQLLDYLTTHHLCDEQVGVLGLSYGGTLALHWAARDPRIRTVVAIAPYNRPDEAMVHFAKEMNIPISQNTVREATVIAAKKMEINWTDWSGETAMRQVKVPVLLIGGEKDTISPPSDIAKLKQLAVAGSKTIEIPAADHIAVSASGEEIASPIKSWFEDHLVTNPSITVQKN